MALLRFGMRLRREELGSTRNSLRVLLHCHSAQTESTWPQRSALDSKMAGMMFLKGALASSSGSLVRMRSRGKPNDRDFLLQGGSRNLSPRSLGLCSSRQHSPRHAKVLALMVGIATRPNVACPELSSPSPTHLAYQNSTLLVFGLPLHLQPWPQDL